MTELNDTLRRFTVRARHLDPHHARLLLEPSFEAAAVAYVEDFPFHGDAEPDLGVVVRDVDGGGEHCFTVDLETGETEPCG